MIADSGEKNVKWFTYKGAVVELINTSPGTTDGSGRPWMFVSVTFPRICMQGSTRGEYLLFPEASRHAASNGRTYLVWESEWIQKCATDARVPYIGGIYVSNDIVRYTWDYMHSWNDEKSHKVWRLHGKNFVDEVIRRLAANSVDYYVECYACKGVLKIVDKFAGLPEEHAELCFHEHCGKLYMSRLLHN